MKKNLLGALIAILANLNLVLEPVNNTLTAQEIFISCIFNESKIFEQKSLVFTFLYAVMIVLFMLLFGGYFQEHLHDTGVYIYTRYKTRIGWYGKYTMQLLYHVVIYTFSYVFCIFGMSIYHTGGQVDVSLVFLMLYVWFILTDIIYLLVLFENIISIRYGMIVGEVAAIAILAWLIHLCLEQENYVIFRKYELLRYVNPLNGMKLYTIASHGIAVGTVIIYLIEILIVWFLGVFVLEHTDILSKK